jgi:hypothetical protein
MAEEFVDHKEMGWCIIQRKDKMVGFEKKALKGRIS